MNQPNFIEHKEEERVFTIPEMVMMGDETIEDFLHRERDTINRAILVAINLMIDLDKDTVPVFAIDEVDCIFNLSREEAKSNIEKYVSYFTEIEDYETCVILINLKSKL